jgi:hypothetical protein
MALYTLRQELKRATFTGQCRKCGQLRSREGYFQWAKRKGIARRSVVSNGYVMLGPTAIPPEDLPLYRAMQNKNGVLEHRYVMAKSLGRPLERDECVDHMDGNRQNNDLGNLRIYVRGRNQPGAVGNGTYYHEWQMALAELRRVRGE